MNWKLGFKYLFQGKIGLAFKTWLVVLIQTGSVPLGFSGLLSVTCGFIVLLASILGELLEISAFGIAGAMAFMPVIILAHMWTKESDMHGLRKIVLMLFMITYSICGMAWGLETAAGGATLDLLCGAALAAGVVTVSQLWLHVMT